MTHDTTSISYTELRESENIYRTYTLFYKNFDLSLPPPRLLPLSESESNSTATLLAGTLSLGQRETTEHVADDVTAVGPAARSGRRNQPLLLVESPDLGFRAAGTVFGFDDLIGDEIFGVRLFASVNDVFGKVQSAGRWSTGDRMVSGRSVRHLHGAEL